MRADAGLASRIYCEVVASLVHVMSEVNRWMIGLRGSEENCFGAGGDRT